jgi:hypothetical protein
MTLWKPALHGHHASFLRATSRSWRHAYRPGISPLSRAPDRSPVRVLKRRHAVRWEIGSSSGPFSPREFVAPRRGFMPSGARCSPGFSISSGLSPSSPWTGASTSPPLTGLAWNPAPPEGVAFLLDRCYKSAGRLPLRVSQSDEAGRSLARPTYPHEVPYLIVQPRSAKVWSSWLMSSPWVPECVAVS